MARLRLFLGLMALLLSAKDCLADEVIGTWLTDEGAMQVRFEHCGEATCGEIVWVRPGADTRAKPGQRLFFDMHPDGRDSWSGKADFDGSVYVSRISIEGTALRTSGCVMTGLFCKTETWTRVPAR